MSIAKEKMANEMFARVATPTFQNLQSKNYIEKCINCSPVECKFFLLKFIA